MSNTNNYHIECIRKKFFTKIRIPNYEATHLIDGEVIEIGNIAHFFSKINVAVVNLTLPLTVGERILIKGPTTDLEQTVESMQIERKDIQRAEAGQSIGLKVILPVKVKDVVYKKL